MKARGQGGIFQRGAVLWVQYYVRGKRYRESSESSNRADAVRLLKRRMGEAASGKPIGPDVAKTTLADLAAMLTNDYRANARRERVIKAPLEHLKRHPDTRHRCIALEKLSIHAGRCLGLGEQLPLGAAGSVRRRRL